MRKVPASRIPPVRLDEAFLAQLALLDPITVSCLIRIGMLHYQGGKPPTVEQARAAAMVDPGAWPAMQMAIGPHLDPDSLSSGHVVVKAFADALDRRDKVRGARSDAASRTHRERSRVQMPVQQRIAAAGSAGASLPVHDQRSDAQMRTGGGNGASKHGHLQLVQTEEIRRAEPSPDEKEIAERLFGLGNVSADEALAHAADWVARYGVRIVRKAFESLPSAKIDKPIPYVRRVIENTRRREQESMPPAIAREAGSGEPVLGASPRPIKRRIKRPHNSRWEFEGWTAAGDPKGKDGRLEVWRTDVGALSYHKPEEGEKVPGFEEDPGVYETD